MNSESRRIHKYQAFPTVEVSEENAVAEMSSESKKIKTLSNGHIMVAYFPRLSWVIMLVTALVIVTTLLITIFPCPTFSLVRAIFGRPKNLKETMAYKYISPYADSSGSSDQLVYSNSTFKVVLFGDSLIKYPEIYYGLTDSIRETLFDVRPVQLFVEAEFGQKVLDLKHALLAGSVSKHRPDAVIMFWDSDVDLDESSMTSSEVEQLRATYISNLEFVVSSLASTVKYVAVAGPAVLGEGRFWFMPNTDRFREKPPMLDDYRIMNKDLAEKYNASYIDIRQAFLDYIPRSQLVYKWCVTDDGEHPNIRGATIVARLFAETINGWLSRDDGL